VKELEQYKQAIEELYGFVTRLYRLERATRQLQKKTRFGELMTAIKRLERQTYDAICEIRTEAEALEPPPLKPERGPVPRRRVN
jgi:hypothetical protein